MKSNKIIDNNFEVFLAERISKIVTSRRKQNQIKYSDTIHDIIVSAKNENYYEEYSCEIGLDLEECYLQGFIDGINLIAKTRL